MASSTASGDLAAALQGLAFIERGWLSSNNVLLHGAPGEGATLVDTGYCTHAEQTLALVRHALGAESLARIVNTHLHSDHCGGNALLQREFGAPLLIPPGQWDAVVAWDEDALSYRPTRQRCVRFRPDAQIVPGEVLRAGAAGDGRRGSDRAGAGRAHDRVEDAARARRDPAALRALDDVRTAGGVRGAAQGFSGAWEVAACRPEGRSLWWFAPLRGWERSGV